MTEQYFDPDFDKICTPTGWPQLSAIVKKAPKDVGEQIRLARNRECEKARKWTDDYEKNRDEMLDLSEVENRKMRDAFTAWVDSGANPFEFSYSPDKGAKSLSMWPHYLINSMIFGDAPKDTYVFDLSHVSVFS